MKKTFLKIIFALMVFSYFFLDVKAISNPYKKSSSYGTNCTWYAWDQAYTKAGVALPGWGNANTWLDSAKKAGYEVGTTPRAKAIAVWEWSSYGHVGYVERVDNGKIYAWDSEGPCIDPDDETTCFNNSIDESSYNECIKNAKTVACEYDATYWSVPGDLIGYIYLDKVPSKPITSDPIKENQSIDNTNTTLKKSSNANLENLIVSTGDFKFEKDILKYELAVANNIEKIKVDAIPQDKKATVVGVGDYDLNIGLNTIKIEVTAEDKTKKVYTLEIKRKDNNAYLDSLTLSSGNINFVKNIFDYKIEIEENINILKVEAISESSSAKIEGTGEYNLSETKEILVKVIAEDDTENIYKIEILKNENKGEIEEKKEDINFKYVIIGSLVLVIMILIIVILRKIKK